MIVFLSKLLNQQVTLLRDHKNVERDYGPRVVSLGPIHYGKSRYRLAEKYKLRLADDFIAKSGKGVGELYEIVEKNITQLKGCFDEEVIKKYDDEDLAWLLFVDGCAILRFIDTTVSGNFSDFKILNAHVAFGQQDLFLLENQLPYQLLDDLMKMSLEEVKLRYSIQSFIDMHSMVQKKTENGNANNKKKRQTTINPSRPKETIRRFSKDRETSMGYYKDKEMPIHLLDLLRTRLLGSTKTKSPNAATLKKVDEKDWQSFRNALELKQAGIQLKRSDTRCLRDISFTKFRNFYPGILSLPPIIVDDSTRSKFLNLIAYEMCPDFENDYGVTSYISFLHSLIDEANDVIELRKARILHNFLGSDQEVAHLFNEIGTDLVPNPEIYGKVRSEIQMYYDNKWKIWISQVVHDHFSHHWTILAFIAALLALILSVIQTCNSANSAN